jgi:hypothetical protein
MFLEDTHADAYKGKELRSWSHGKDEHPAAGIVALSLLGLI